LDWVGVHRQHCGRDEKQDSALYRKSAYEQQRHPSAQEADFFGELVASQFEFGSNQILGVVHQVGQDHRPGGSFEIFGIASHRFQLRFDGSEEVRAHRCSLEGAASMPTAKRRTPRSGIALAPLVCSPSRPKEYHMNVSNLAWTVGSMIGAHKAQNVARSLEDGVLGVIGLERRRSMLDRVLPAVGLFGAGAAAGAACALLLAPASGAETRARIRGRVRDAKEQFDEGLRRGEEKLHEAAGRVQSAAEREHITRN
jgi:hypothetical protein